MKWIMRGKVWKFGDRINDNLIIPIQYLYSEPDELARHCMEGVDPDFPQKVKKGDFIVAGMAFGCGHPHWQSNIALKHAGVAAVIAESFSRMFFRHSINLGLPVLPCKDITRKVYQGDGLEVNFRTGDIRNLATGEVVKTDPLPTFLMDTLGAGGLRNALKKRLRKLAVEGV